MFPAIVFLNTNYSLLDYLPGAIERDTAIAFHTSMPLLISWGISEKNYFVYPIAVLLHTLLGMLAITAYVTTKNVWIAEAVIAMNISMYSYCILVIIQRDIRCLIPCEYPGSTGVHQISTRP